MRTNISARAALWLRWLAAALGIAISIWILAKSWTIFRLQTPPTEHASLSAVQIQDIFGLRFSAAVAVVLVWGWIRTSRNLRVPALLGLLLAALSIYALPTASGCKPVLSPPPQTSTNLRIGQAPFRRRAPCSSYRHRTSERSSGSRCSGLTTYRWISPRASCFRGRADSEVERRFRSAAAAHGSKLGNIDQFAVLGPGLDARTRCRHVR